MSTWHQRRGGMRGVWNADATEWKVVIDPPERATSVMTFATESAARRYAEKVSHSTVIPPMTNRNPGRGSKAGRAWDAKVGRRRGHRGGFTTPFRIEKWEERDRLHIALEDANGRTIIEWWDDEAREAIEDGFLKPRDLLGSATEYAEHMGLL